MAAPAGADVAAAAAAGIVGMDVGAAGAAWPVAVLAIESVGLAAGTFVVVVTGRKRPC